ncbi:MAG: hypothetical protein JXI43_06720 [Tissierellales bacterium]|nr:hypothetical protein [Tissierellales bacterium]
MEILNLFFTRIKEITFWQRMFSWSKIRTLSYDAFEQFKQIEKDMEAQKQRIEQLNNDITQIKTHNENLKDRVQNFDIDKLKYENEIQQLRNKNTELSQSISELSNKISKYETTDEERSRQYEAKIAQLNQLKESLDSDRKKLSDDRVREKEEELINLKKSWSEHQSSVEQHIKLICQNYMINYIDKVPFKGNPDNTIEICGEYIIFDAKSPANDDLTSFPKYLKTQTESIKKYANQENVKKDIFLVIPSNTIESISKYYYNMGDYNVYIITKDSIEPIMLSLRKIEEYEFAEKLSPEDRDNICRIIGKFAHTTKRKIQIDQFFTVQFMELLVKCSNELPDDILNQVLEFEKAEKLNPPPEKRAKQIPIKELEEKNIKINTEANIRAIEIPASFEDVQKLD